LTHAGVITTPDGLDEQLLIPAVTLSAADWQTGGPSPGAVEDAVDDEEPAPAWRLDAVPLAAGDVGPGTCALPHPASEPVMATVSATRTMRRPRARRKSAGKEPENGKEPGKEPGNGKEPGKEPGKRKGARKGARSREHVHVTSWSSNDSDE